MQLLPIARGCRRWVVLCAAVCVLLLMTGCYEQVSKDGQSIYRFAWWLGPVVIAGGVLFVPAGWWLRKVIPRLGWTLILMSPVLLILIAPALYHDRVVIDDEHVETQTGFWFNPRVRNVRFDELAEVRLVETQAARGGTSRDLLCIHADGTVVEIDVGDLVKFAVPEIMDRARAHGIHTEERRLR